MTGRFPRDHGVLSATTYRLRGSTSDCGACCPRARRRAAGAGAASPARGRSPRRARRRRALWNVLDAFGIPTGLVRVWGTHPPEAIRGSSCRPTSTCCAATRRAPAPRSTRATSCRRWPRAWCRRTTSTRRSLASFVEGARSTAPLGDPRLRALAESALAPDLTYAAGGRGAERQPIAPRCWSLNFNGYDTAGHSFYRYAHPEAFGDVRPEDARRYGRVLERYAALVGGWVGDWQKELGPGDVLVVVSGPRPRADAALAPAAGRADRHARRLGLARRRPRTACCWWWARGSGRAVLMAGCSALDVAPTLLYLLGLPVPRDMEGRVLTEILEPAFAREHPVTFIPSYESLAVAPAVPGTPLDVLPLLPEE